MTAYFTSGAIDIQPHEIVAHLLRTTGQDAPGIIDTPALLDRLKLRAVTFDFENNLPPIVRARGAVPRALLSFRDRLIAIDTGLKEQRARFSCLHEIAHYVLPAHQYAFYLCDDGDLSHTTPLALEAEANRLAADLMFKGGHFTREANDGRPSARTIKALALRYGASFEATARRLAERNLRPVMLMVFSRDTASALASPNSSPPWRVRYCASSPTFRARFFARLQGEVPDQIARTLEAENRDIAESIMDTIEVGSFGAEREVFDVEWFWNHWSIMGLVSPAK